MEISTLYVKFTNNNSMDKSQALKTISIFSRANSIMTVYESSKAPLLALKQTFDEFAESGHNNPFCAIIYLIVDHIKNNTSDLISSATYMMKNLHRVNTKSGVKIIDILLSAGLNPNEKLENDCSPLYWALEGAHKGAVETLIARGAELNIGGSGETLKIRASSVLPSACLLLNPKLVEQLISLGADLNYRSDSSLVTKKPLFTICSRSLRVDDDEQETEDIEIQIVKMLLKGRCDVNKYHYQSIGLESSLLAACSMNKPKIVQLLLNAMKKGCIAPEESILQSYHSFEKPIKKILENNGVAVGLAQPSTPFENILRGDAGPTFNSSRCETRLLAP